MNSITTRLIVREGTIVKVAVNSLIHTLAILLFIYGLFNFGGSSSAGGFSMEL
jgi:hypothetical protein